MQNLGRNCFDFLFHVQKMLWTSLAITLYVEKGFVPISMECNRQLKVTEQKTAELKH